MRIQALNIYNGVSNAVSFGVSKDVNSAKVSFKGEETDRALLAYKIYQLRNDIKLMQAEYDAIANIARAGLPFDVEKAANLKADIIELTDKFNNLDKEYSAYNTTRYQFIDDVENGKLIKIINQTPTDDGSESYSDTMGTSPGDFTFYC